MEKRAPHGGGFVLAVLLGAMLSVGFVVIVLVMKIELTNKAKPLTDWSQQRTECARQNGHLWPDSFSTVWCVETATGKRLYKPRRKPRKSKIW